MYKLIIHLFLVSIFACTNAVVKEDFANKKNALNIEKDDRLQPFFIKLTKLHLTGDFDGDGYKDSVQQNLINQITNLPIDNIPGKLDFDERTKFFDSMETDVILTSQNLNLDTLHFSVAKGLYCLINIGDNNSDKKDEIALVVINNDFSSLNRCYIYTICQNKFKELMHFNINERAFDFNTEKAPIFKEIKGFLEKRQNHWHYMDYDRWMNAQLPKDTILQPLKIKKAC